MKKSEQIEINNKCMEAMEEFNKSGFSYMEKPKTRLDSCTAWIYENDRYYVLQSYNTIVAFIDKTTNTLYDVLRYVYGYTATSGKHIAKFRRYNKIGVWEYGKELTYRAV